ncbi:hypothetical protein XENTR_v10015224 [Xenopus tropicalis]|nr:hypothetical protein XENTR_v10015224 [Xenopus tropicalis]
MCICWSLGQLRVKQAPQEPKNQARPIQDGEKHQQERDAGYEVLPWLMTPVWFPRTPAQRRYNRAQRRYNRAHRKTRNVIGRLLGVLKSHF